MSRRHVPLAVLALLALVAGCRGRSERRSDDSALGMQVDATPLPRVNVPVADRARWYALLRWPATCEEEFRATRVTDDGGLEFVELEPKRSLVIVRCALGAYQPSSSFVLLDERGTSPVASVLQVETITSLDGKTITRTRGLEVAGEIGVLRPGTLTVLALARQIGDCGTWSRYEFRDGRLELTAAAERMACPPEPGPRAEPSAGEPPAGWKPISLG